MARVFDHHLFNRLARFGAQLRFPPRLSPAFLLALLTVQQDQAEHGLSDSLASVACGLEVDQVNLYRAAEKQAINEIRPSLAGERVGNVADLKRGAWA